MAYLTSWLRELAQLLGIEPNTTSYTEKLISALGAFLGIAGVCWVSQWYLDPQGTAMIVASMGASAVLLYAVPHGALSQPWPVVAGHVVSAAIGVSCYKLFGGSPWAFALAVGASVGAMYYLRCIHPPGGATALTAVIGGEQIQALGYHYVVYPILINVVVIVAVAVVFNSAFHWRRYPVHIVRRHQKAAATPAERRVELTHEDFSAAMQQMNSLIDVTAEDLARLFELAVTHAEQNAAHPANIIAGHYYSNGQLGERWSICQVIDASEANGRSGEKVIYKTVAGAGAYDTGVCLKRDFHRWARFEVVLRDGHWVRVSAGSTNKASAES